MLRWIIIQNRQGKSRLSKFWAPYDDDEKVRIRGEVHRLIAPRDQKYQSNFVEYRNHKIVYRRYAGLFFCVCVDANDNELAYLEAIHLFVEILDTFFGNVCELDLVFNFYKVYSILDEVFLAGEIEETSKTVVLSRLDQRMLGYVALDVDAEWEIFANRNSSGEA
ncbi:AP-2 complex subunit sigma [Tilletia horrida]|uniref:AP complex subunit sigma n=1 Tax=Tilletia horrida TaxID=155126 RepID=A0AAN6JUG6_9BASI|nr:AP-2 complex subunit sigma [Tilletia horrida]